MNKFMKKIVTGVLALTMVLGTVLSVSATVSTPGPLQEKPNALGTIQKVLQVPNGVTQPDEDFNFLFTANGVLAADGTLITADQNDPNYVAPGAMPAIGTVTIEDTDLSSDGTSVSGFQLFKGNADALKGIAPTAWPHAGVYKYTVAETPGTLNAAIMKYSKAVYEMYVYVTNLDTSAGTLKVDHVGFRIITNEDVGIVQPVKTPIPTITPTAIPGQNTNAPKDNPIFTNRYTPPMDLEVSKVVANEFADATKMFVYTLEIERPLAAAQAHTGTSPADDLVYYGEIFNSTSFDLTSPTAGRVIVTFKPGEQLGTVSTAGYPAGQVPAAGTFTLKHNQSLDFLRPDLAVDAGNMTGLPAGSTYTITEAAAPGYLPTVDVWNNAQGLSPVPKTETQTGTRGDAWTVGGTGALQATVLTLGDGLNRTAWTNTYEDIIPTGILLNNLPFILLIVVALGGFVGYIAIKRRKATN